MSSSIRLIAIIAGLAAVIVVGTLSYRSYQSRLKPPATTNQTVPNVNDTNQVSKDKNTGSSASAELPVLPAAPTEQQTQNYFKQVAEMAVESDTLSFTQCQGNPPVIKFTKGQRLTLKNNDNEKINVNIDVDNRFVLSAKESKTIQPKLNTATYYVACEQGTTSQASILYVLP